VDAAAGGWGELMLQQSHPVLAWILEYWTVTIFVPAILVLVAVLAFVTHRWDQRDESVRERPHREGAPRPPSAP